MLSGVAAILGILWTIGKRDQTRTNNPQKTEMNSSTFIKVPQSSSPCPSHPTWSEIRLIELHDFASNTSPIFVSEIRSGPSLPTNVPQMIDEGCRHDSRRDEFYQRIRCTAAVAETRGTENAREYSAPDTLLTAEATAILRGRQFDGPYRR